MSALITELQHAAEAVGPSPGEQFVRDAFAAVLPLQSSHLQLMARMNGASFASSYIRLFGVQAHARNVFEWNDPRLWKFSWDEAMQDFFCFGETAFGDQFALRYDGVVPYVYRISVDGGLARIADSFDEFLVWLSAAVRSPDEHILAAQSRFPRVPWDKHLVQVPPELLVGRFAPEFLRPMSAVSSMVAAGDLTRQIHLPGNEERRVIRLDTYIDENDRGRLRVIWADEVS
ncbi:MAG: SMI1/KNR4 family protein [Polyangiales bacterium]